MVKERQRITVDLDELFPGEVFTLGTQNLVIPPLESGQISDIFKKIKALISSLKDDGVTFQNYMDPENMLKLATVVLDQSPELLAECSNIHVDDIKRLPIEKIVELMTVIIEVNIKAKESLLGNLASLAGIFTKLVPAETKMETPEENPEKTIAE